MAYPSYKAKRTLIQESHSPAFIKNSAKSRFSPERRLLLKGLRAWGLGPSLGSFFRVLGLKSLCFAEVQKKTSRVRKKIWGQDTAFAGSSKEEVLFKHTAVDRSCTMGSEEDKNWF